MNSPKILEDPSRRRILDRLPLLVGKRRVMRRERLAHTILQSGIDQQTYRHHHQQRHDALGLFEIERGGQKARVFEESKPAFRMTLPFVAVEELLRRQLLGIEFIGGQNETTVLGESALSQSEGGSEGAFNLIPHVIGLGVLSRSSPLAIARYGPNPDVVESGRLSGLLKGGKGLLRIGLTGKGGTTQLLESLAFLLALREPLRVHRPHGLSPAMLGVHKHPALFHPAIG
jgi:hypothetical protein